MGLGLELNTIIAYGFGIFLLYIIGSFFFKPLRVVFRVLLNVLIGIVVLIVLNLVGQYVGVSVAVNLYNAALIGILGVPGIILVLLLQFILV
ncbi:MAG: pro-sigmaK processing inhibitor BofA family protein [Mahellales bacterium]